MRTFLSGLAIAILAHAETAQADTVETFMNGNSLLAYCQGDAPDRSECLGYIEGVADDWETVRHVRGLSPCTGPDVTAGQVKDVVVNWLIANPAHRHETAAGLVVFAITNAWHCR
jgi:Rap1a immunity proteins